MAKLRFYYDKSGKILETEHRTDENYTEENKSRHDLSWIVVDSEALGEESVDAFEVKRNKIMKRKSS